MMILLLCPKPIKHKTISSNSIYVCHVKENEYPDCPCFFAATVVNGLGFVIVFVVSCLRT